MPIPSHVANRLKVDRARARVALRGANLVATDVEIDAALSEINQDTIFDAERSTWTTQVWDRVSPINGVPAQHFLDREDVNEAGGDDIYLLLKDNVVVAFQPHDPDAAGFVRIPKGQGLARGNRHADVVAADRAVEEVIRRVGSRIEELRSTR